MMQLIKVLSSDMITAQWIPWTKPFWYSSSRMWMDQFNNVSTEKIETMIVEVNWLVRKARITCILIMISSGAIL